MFVSQGFKKQEFECFIWNVFNFFHKKLIHRCRGGELNYLSPQISLDTILKVDHILTKINKNIGCSPRKGCQPRPFLPNTCCWSPKWTNFQTWASCHIPFEKEISAESHLEYQKTPIKPLNQHIKYSEFFTFLVKKS